MRAKVVILALFASIAALPVPASQMLTGTFSAPSPAARVVPGDAGFALLLRDPFLMDEMALTHVRGRSELETALNVRHF